MRADTPRPQDSDHKLLDDKGVNADNFPLLYEHFAPTSGKLRVFLLGLETAARAKTRVKIDPVLVQNQGLCLELFALLARCGHRMQDFTLLEQNTPTEEASVPSRPGQTMVRASIYGSQGLLMGPQDDVKVQGRIPGLPCLDFTPQAKAFLSPSQAQDLRETLRRRSGQSGPATHRAAARVSVGNVLSQGKSRKQEIIDRLGGKL